MSNNLKEEGIKRMKKLGLANFFGYINLSVVD